jgi:hypothetical protein
MKNWTVAILSAALMITFGGMAYGGMFDAVKSAVSGGGGGGLKKTDVDTYFKLSKKADGLQQGSIDKLAGMLLNKETVAQIERKNKAAQSIQDPKEREAALNKVMIEKEAAVEQAANSKEANQKLAQLDVHHKKLAGEAICNLFLSALTNKSACDVATGIVQKAKASPTSAVAYATELPKIKDAVVSLPGKIEKTYTLGNQLVTLAKANNVEITIPKSASDKPQEVDI